MHKDSTAQAKQKKDEREEVLKEIRQLENRQKILENKQRNEERKARTRRLIERGAILEGIFPSAPRPFRRRGQSVPDCPVPSSGGGGTGRKTAEIRGQAVSPLFTRAHLYTVAGVVRPAGGCQRTSSAMGSYTPQTPCAPQVTEHPQAAVPSPAAEYPSPKGGAPHRFLSYPRQYHQAQRGPFRCCRSRLPKRNQADE